MDPTESAAYSYLGACYNSMNDNKRAIKYFHIANEYDNVATIYLSALSSLYMENKQWEKSIPYIKQSKMQWTMII